MTSPNSSANSSKPLLLVPTQLECDRLMNDAELRGLVERGEVGLRLCGFGPIAAAARTAEAIAERSFSRVILAGIAGSYGENLKVGSAYLFDKVACWGIGAGTGAGFLTGTQIGFSQLDDSVSPANPRDLLALEERYLTVSEERGGLLLTCCAAAGNLHDCQQRLALFPEAAAEDMEGFGVALACQRASVPLTIVRGISNRAGDRDVRNWQIAPALTATANLLSKLFSESSETESRP